ncbi:bacillithiol system redox-active protein YtxJ [Tenacibaculum crassostreae]|uniref:bacillithiol system redox-active protein YtxJ n=1 Tax=Tenacibaculum crassostreae TaxID=502683 RepID=UPI00389541BE
MSIFNIFKNKKDSKEEQKSNINWIPLTNMQQLEEIKRQSENEPVAIFKHSTRCGISSMVIKRFANSFDEELKSYKVYYLDLLNYREISNEIAYTFQVLHQSPQLLVIKKGEVVSHASHYDIAQINLKKF